jgi:pimeloyl-ACP methyl ester carboxylesterase
MPLSSFADGSIFGTKHGDNPARVLALPGWGRTHSDFDEALRGLDAIALDLPGFGASPAPPEAGGSDMYAGLVAPVLRQCAHPVVVVGHSFGGRVAAHLAVDHPEKITALVLAGVPLLHRSERRAAPAFKYRVGRALHRIGLLGEDRMGALRDKYGSADYRAAEGIIRDILVTTVNESYEDQLRQIQQHLELVWGSNDDAVPLEVAIRAEEMLSNARLTVVDNAGHHIPTDAPGTLREAIERCLEVQQ